MDRAVYDTLVVARGALFASVLDPDTDQVVPAWFDTAEGAIARIDALLDGVPDAVTDFGTQLLRVGHCDCCPRQHAAVTESSLGQHVCTVCGAPSTLSINVCAEHAGLVEPRTVG